MNTPRMTYFPPRAQSPVVSHEQMPGKAASLIFRGALIAFAVVATLALAGCSHSEPAKPDANTPRVAATTVPIQRTAWPETLDVPGTVHAVTEAVISSRVMGVIASMPVKEGDSVRAGQVLATLDTREMDSAAAAAAAAVDEAKAAAPEADQAVAGASAQLELAQVTHDRLQRLFEKQSVSRQELDESTARLKGAQSALDMARARRAQVEARIRQATSAAASASIMKGYTRLLAPFDGLVTSRPGQVGILAAPGVPLLVLEKGKAHRLEVAVEESRLPALHPGDPVSLTFPALAAPLDARISEILPAVDAATRTATIRINLPSSPELRSGLFGRARLTLGRRMALVVPSSAVVERGQIQSVYVVENGVARSRLVTLGARDGDRCEVLTGLEQGERVVAPVPAGLSDGARVEVRQ